MNDLNEIGTIKIGNCIAHICDNAIEKSKEKQEEIWQSFTSTICKSS